jgi:cation diffusion facilitator CzcD-associated flavoprotein CzcO
MSSGPLNRPKLPGVPGMARFKGHSFHTSRWDYAYTGGNSDGGLTRLADKRVAIIGTGATAIQCVPHLGRDAKHLYVFQRTPSSVDLRGNRPTDPAWAKSLSPGWQKRRMENFNTLVNGGVQDEDLVSDGWTDVFRKLGIAAVRRKDVQASLLEFAKAMEIADFEKMNEIRSRVDETVQDPRAAEALKPWYRQFCKRPTFNDEYLPTFNRPNVTLVDTEGRGVEEITEKGLMFDGVEYEVDCIIFATGFEVGTSYTRRAGIEVIGREGVTLTSHWEDGIKTLHGMSAHGFPNCFHMGITQNTLTPNFPHMLDEQARYVADVVQHAEQRQAQTIEPTAEAEADWCETIRRLSIQSVQFQMDCTPGYYNGEGKPGQGRGFLDNLYGPGSVAFFDLVRNWRENERMAGLEFG